MPTTRLINDFPFTPDPFLEDMSEFALARTLDAANVAGTDYGRVLAGAPLCVDSVSGLLRPMGNTLVAATAVAAAVTVAEADGFHIGDLVDIRSTLGRAGTVVIDADGAGTANIVLTSLENDGLAHTLQLRNPADAAHVSTVGYSTITAGVEALIIDLSNGAGPAIDATVGEVIGAINANSTKFRASLQAGGNAASTAVAVAATPLANGRAAGATYSAAGVVTAVNTTANTVTFGGAIDADAGDAFVLTGMETCAGLLRGDVNTAIGSIGADGLPLRHDPPCKLVLRGVLDSSEAQVALTATTFRARVYSAAVTAQLNNILFV